MPQGKLTSFLLLVLIAFLVVVVITKFFGNLIFLLLFVVGPLLGWLVISYNKLQGMSHEIQEAHSNIMVSMKKRLDLTNKLIDIASGYGEHEKLTHITVSQTESLNAFQQVDGALNKIISMAGTYPELKANQTYQLLMQQLENIEADLQHKREYYNGVVRRYNSTVTAIPISLISDQLGFNQAPYFNVENADVLENLKDFKMNDGEALKNLFTNVSQKVVDSSKNIGAELNRSTHNLLDQSTNNKENNQNSSQ